MAQPSDNLAAWPPLRIERDGAVVTLRVATLADAPTLERWDREPDVTSAATDDPDAEQAFENADWRAEIAAASPVSCYFIAELDGRPIGAMQVIDPRLEPTHYWGEIEPNLRAVDIWIGAAGDRGRGWGAAMMAAVIDRCFADASVTAIIIDPLATNTRAHFFYQRLGFRPVGRRMFNDEDDCLVHRLERGQWRKRSKE